MLLDYVWEDKNDTQPHELFKIVITFCENFQAVADDIEQMEKAEVRSWFFFLYTYWLIYWNVYNLTIINPFFLREGKK